MRSAMRAASQLPGRGPTDVDDALQGGPLMWMMPLHIYQKSDYDDMMIISNKNYITMQFHCVVKKVHDLKDSGKMKKVNKQCLLDTPAQ